MTSFLYFSSYLLSFGYISLSHYHHYHHLAFSLWWRTLPCCEFPNGRFLWQETEGSLWPKSLIIHGPIWIFKRNGSKQNTMHVNLVLHYFLQSSFQGWDGSLQQNCESMKSCENFIYWIQLTIPRFLTHKYCEITTVSSRYFVIVYSAIVHNQYIPWWIDFWWKKLYYTFVNYFMIIFPFFHSSLKTRMYGQKRKYRLEYSVFIYIHIYAHIKTHICMYACSRCTKILKY